VFDIDTARAYRKPVRSAAVLLVPMLLLAACHRVATQRVDYLNTSVGTASEDQVMSNLGPPATSRSLASTGGEVWVYRYQGFHLYAGMTCTEFLLTFDRTKTLRSWTRDRGCQDRFPAD
jgi:hypothetical protein